MKEFHLNIPNKIFYQLRSHILRSFLEGAAFAYVKASETKGKVIFKVIDWDPVNEDGFESRSEYHLSLNSEAQAKIIKKAHDLDASLVEFHSHSGYLPVKFSGTDFLGFNEFIPHVWWRLEGKPYIAVVINQNGFDGLVWIENPDTPHQLSSIKVDEDILIPTKRTLKEGVEL